jgi:hypothetical protein
MVLVYIGFKSQRDQAHKLYSSNHTLDTDLSSFCTQNSRQTRVTKTEARFLHSILALGIEKVVMEMVSSMFY